MPALTEDEITNYKREHGQLVMIQLPIPDGSDADPVQLLFKKAPPAVWADYQEAITKDKGTHTAAFRRLAHACRVHPESKELEAVFRDYPALPTKIANLITNISGQGDEFEVKKL